MIVDHIDNARLYYRLGANFEKALHALKKYTVSFNDGGSNSFEKSDIPVDSDKVFIKVRPYNTKPVSECSFEAHCLYADIHFVVDGCEKIGYADISNMQTLRTDEEKDMVYLKGDGEFITLRKGFFMITLPNDAHMPGVIAEKPGFCHKLIAKVKLGGKEYE
jgi:YhcH/YjgK/YiaL family protein